MFDSLKNLFGGNKLDEAKVPLREGKLKIILKERRGERYVYMRFSYPGNTQYHVLFEEDLDGVIATLTRYRSLMGGHSSGRSKGTLIPASSRKPNSGSTTD